MEMYGHLSQDFHLLYNKKLKELKFSRQCDMISKVCKKLFSKSWLIQKINL